jgi:hypothetical protein
MKSNGADFSLVVKRSLMHDNLLHFVELFKYFYIINGFAENLLFRSQQPYMEFLCKKHKDESFW